MTELQEKHRSVPQTMTPEMLAQWIKDNAKETVEHVEKVELDEETVHDLEKKSSLASRAIDRLEDIKKTFMDVLKDGTPDRDMPYDVTIPPTAGLKILKANRAFADKQLEQGFREDNTTVYMIPYPEDSLMVGVDIEGYEWPQYTRQMTIEEINQNKPMLRKEKPKKEKKSVVKDEDSFMEEESGEEHITLDL